MFGPLFTAVLLVGVQDANSAAAQPPAGAATPAVAAASTPAADVPAAPPADARRVLWQNIRFGMSRAEVQALYPAAQHVHHRPAFTEIDEFRVLEGCEAEVNIHHENSSVDRVVVNGGGSLGGRCSDQVLTALSARYGQPLSETSSRGSILAREGRVYVWMRDGIALRLKRFSSGVFGGGGLAAASWELTYSTVADDAAL